VDSPEDFPRVKQAGFTAVQTYAKDRRALATYVEAAAGAGLKALVFPQEWVGRGPAPGQAVLAWYLADEPEVDGLAPDRVAALEREVKSWDPFRRTALGIGIGSAATQYRAIGDVLLLDWYPVPHLPLSSVGEQIRQARGQAGGRPVWAVLQAFDWRDFPQRGPNRIGRFPTYEEMKFMTALALVRGARGLFPARGRTRP